MSQPVSAETGIDGSAGGGGTAVLVVGAGPVGLAAACELRRRGVAFRVIDDGDGPTPPRESRAFGIHARTLEVFDDMGVIDPVLRKGRRVRSVNAYDRGRQFVRFEPDFGGTGTPYPFVLSLSQGETEQALIDRLAALGGTVEWRTKLTALRQDDRGVTAALTGPDGRDRETRADWLIGCDGAHSVVRHQLGLSYTGAAYPEKFLLADARIDWNLSPDGAHLLLTPGGPVAALPLPEPNLWRLIDTTGAGDADGPDAIAARFRELVRVAGFPAVTIEEPVWTSAFRIHRRAVERLRVGRCFLAGDAAHIHSPVGGQGMNTGIQDAYNLAWKLALVVAGAAPESLLDSYEAERLPIAMSVLRNTQLATRIVTLRNPVARSVRNGLARWLTKRTAVVRRLTRNLSELAVCYRGSPIAAEGWSDPAEDGPRPGDRVPDMPWPSTDEPRRLFDVLRGTRSTLLLFDGTEGRTIARDTTAEIESLIREREERIAGYRIVAPRPADDSEDGLPRVSDADGSLGRCFGVRFPALYFIRPDGYVGYRSSPPNPQPFAAYLRRLFS